MRRVACISFSRAVHRDALVCVAEAALEFGPSVAFDERKHLVWIEVGGCSHLHGGESALARAIGLRVQALGHESRVAVAGGPLVAAAVARFANHPLVVSEGRDAEAMQALPIAALELDAETEQWLEDLGLRTCGDLQKLPRSSLGARLGTRARDVFQLLDGDDRKPLDVWRPPECPVERVELEWGTDSTEALGFVLKMLCDRLAARLEGRAMAAARLEIAFGLDGGGGRCTTIEVTLPVPLMRAADLFAVARARIEGQKLDAPVLSVSLRASLLARVQARTLDLLSPEPKARRALPRLVAELAADFGGDGVGMLALVDTWASDERTKLVPFGGRSQMFEGSRGSPRAPPLPRHALVSGALEPSRLVGPIRVPNAALAKATLLARLEAFEWWRRGVERRDVFAAFGSFGGYPAALGWLERRVSGTRSAAVQLLGWVD